MKAAVFTFTKNGARTGSRLSELLRLEGFDAVCYAVKEYVSFGSEVIPMMANLKSYVECEFARCDIIAFIGSLGIAVRAVSPFLRGKAEDPAVLCMDEQAKFVIPVLSGHIGGANGYARKIAAALGTEAVITTATDVNGVFAADQWAAERGFIIAVPDKIKYVSKALLDGETVGLYTDSEVKGVLPAGVTREQGLAAGIAISTDSRLQPFKNTLNIMPNVLHLGIGCRKNTVLEDIAAAVVETLEENGADIRCVRGIASINIKENEAGLLSFAERLEVPVSFYTAEELSRAEGRFTASGFVKSVTDVDNVCERAAVLSSGGGRLIIKKTAKNGVTVAAAEADWDICFQD